MEALKEILFYNHHEQLFENDFKTPLSISVLRNQNFAQIWNIRTLRRTLQSVCHKHLTRFIINYQFETFTLFFNTLTTVELVLLNQAHHQFTDIKGWESYNSCF